MHIEVAGVKRMRWSGKANSAIARLTVAWLTGMLSIITAAAQRCDGIAVEIGANEQRCRKPGTGQSFKDCPDCPEMVVIPAGSFTMGSR
jgi:formylglycine-generating enzyme required for sulfatase activity